MQKPLPAKTVFLLMLCCIAVTQIAPGQAIDGCPIFPNDNIWNAPIDILPVHTNSAQFVATIGANANVHPDFGSGTFNGGPIGIPYVVVPGNQPKVAVSFEYDDESDPGPYPIPPIPPIEGGPNSNGDRHVLILDRDNCVLYELYSAYPEDNGTWSAGSGAIYDLTSHNLRPAGWTSADAAGLPILPGLARYDEAAAGEINHALRFTAPQTRREYIWPARHFASSLTGAQYPPLGLRFRLRADFDVSGYSAINQTILAALKKYGMILADNGSAWFISGAPDERWDNDDLRDLRQLRGSDFEAVDVSALMLDPDSGQVPALVESNCEVRFLGYHAIGGLIEDVLVDAARNRYWLLIKDLDLVRGYNLDTGQLLDSLPTGGEPESYAMTYDRQYLGVGSREDTFITVIDLANNQSLGNFTNPDSNKIFRISAVGVMDFIFVSRPDSFGSPPFGGQVYLWRGATQDVVKLQDIGWGAQNYLFGLAPSDQFLISKWGFSQGGIELLEFNRNTLEATVNDFHFTNVFLGSSTMHGFDGMHSQFILNDDWVIIENQNLGFISDLPFNHSDTRVIFNPLDPFLLIHAPLDAEQLEVFNLDTFQPEFMIDLPFGIRWRGKGAFSDDGHQLALLGRNPLNSMGVAHYELSIASPRRVQNHLLNIMQLTTPAQVPLNVNGDAALDVGDIITLVNQCQ